MHVKLIRQYKNCLWLHLAVTDGTHVHLNVAQHRGRYDFNLYVYIFIKQLTVQFIISRWSWQGGVHVAQDVLPAALLTCQVSFRQQVFSYVNKTVRVSQLYLYIPITPITVCLKNRLQSVQLQHSTVVQLHAGDAHLWSEPHHLPEDCNTHTVGRDWCKECTEKGSVFWVRLWAREGVELKDASVKEYSKKWEVLSNSAIAPQMGYKPQPVVEEVFTSRTKEKTNSNATM